LNEHLEVAYVAATKDVREVVSTAFAILAKYRRADGWFYLSEEIAVAAIATAAFRTGELIVQVPLSAVRRVAGAGNNPRRSIGNIIALLVALAGIAAGILVAVMRHA
jgi:hypothetical protein